MQLTLAVKGYLHYGIHPIEDLQPSTILVEAKDPRLQILKFKVLDPQYFTGERSIYERKRANPSYSAIFCPKALEDFCQNRTKCTASYESSIVWSIGSFLVIQGMIALTSALGQNYTSFYNWGDRPELRFGLLETSIQRLYSLQYSFQLGTLIENMLRIEEANRASLADIATAFHCNPIDPSILSKLKTEDVGGSDLPKFTTAQPPEPLLFGNSVMDNSFFKKPLALRSNYGAMNQSRYPN